MNTSSLPEIGFIRLPEVLKLIPVSKSNWWAGVRSGRYPKSVKLEGNITAWDVADIRAYIKAKTESTATS